MTVLHTASYRAWTPGLGTPVRTSLGTPRIDGAAGWPRCWPITPRGSYLRASAEVYTAAYLGQLDRYGARRIAQELAAITRKTGGGGAAALLLRDRPGAVPPLPARRLVATGHGRTHHRTRPRRDRAEVSGPGRS